MQQSNINKQTNRGWTATDNLVKVVRSSNQAITIPKVTQNSLEYTNNWSIALSCTHSTNSTEYIYHDLNTTTGKGFYIKASSGTSIDFFISDGTNNNTVSVTIPVGLAAYIKRIVVTYNASTKTVILKAGDFGTTTQVVTLTSSITNTQVVTLGNNFAQNSGINGLIGFVKLFNKVLTQEDIYSLDKDLAIIPKTLHINCVGFWTGQEKYGNKIYDSVAQFNYAKGTPLTSNHADLIGYSGTELGTTDKTTQTSRVDFYDKTTTTWWTGSGNSAPEIKSGLPEIKDALRCYLTGAIPATRGGNNPSVSGVLANASTNNFSGIFYFYWNGTLGTNPSSSGLTVLATFSGSTNFSAIRVFYPTTTTARVNIAVNDISVIDFSLAKAGLYAVGFSIDRLGHNAWFARDVEITQVINSNLWITGKTISNINVMENHPNYSNDNVLFIGAYLYNRDISRKEYFNSFKSGLFANPPKDYAGGWNMHTFNTSTKIFTDLSSNGNNITMTGFTTNEMTPAHADYAIKDINTLR